MGKTLPRSLMLAAAAVVLIAIALAAGAIRAGQRSDAGPVAVSGPATASANTPTALVEEPITATAPPATPSSVSPVSTPEPAVPAAASAAVLPASSGFFDQHRIVSYYGSPLAAVLGILGEYPPEEMVRRLRIQADAYQAADPSKQVVPALNLLYGLAQAAPGADGLYLGRLPDEVVRQWIEIARAHNLMLFLEMQFGRSTVERELPPMLPYLTDPQVHIALDPEFAWYPNRTPADLGYLDAADINRAQELVSNYLTEHNLPPRVMIVHQFRLSMITNRDRISAYPNIDLVINADGFGAPGVKIQAYNAITQTGGGVRIPGVKLFYQYDIPLMSEQAILDLVPTPLVIMYQ